MDTSAGQTDMFEQPRLNACPDACPIGYHRDATDDEMADIMMLRNAGLSPLVWAVHFVLKEQCRTVAQFCSFQANEEWGSDSAALLDARQKLLSGRNALA